MKHHDMI